MTDGYHQVIPGSNFKLTFLLMLTQSNKMRQKFIYVILI